MKRVVFLALACLAVLGLLGCSIEFNQLAVSIPSSDAESSTPPAAGPGNQTPSQLGTTVPVTWAGLNLTGRLVYIRTSTDGGFALRIHLLDLRTGEIHTLFTTSSDDWIFYVTLSPDAKQLVMSYIPPSQEGTSSSRALYVMPLDGATTPRPLFRPQTVDDHYTQAEWSPDGQYIYYAHYNRNVWPAGQLDPTYRLFRMRYPDGPVEKIAEPAFWPRLSPHSNKLAYISIDPDSGKNDLYVANADGSNPQRVVFSGPWIPDVIDAPIFSPDGGSILFSAPPPPQAYQPAWFERWMGVRVAHAHNVPSDWWSVPVTGGVPARLTQLQTINLFASLSPDQRHIASVSGEGLFVMDPDDSNLTRLLADIGVSGTVSWIP